MSISTPEVGTLRRLTAFTTDPAGGNPAGVWIGPTLPAPSRMQEIAAEVGYSETAFLAPSAEGRFLTRYYSPRAEVSFCGHATIASGVALGQRDGPGRFVLETTVGDVAVQVSSTEEGMTAALTSVETKQKPVPAETLSEALGALDLTPDDLDPAIPPVLAWAGAWHLILATRDPATHAAMRYDFDRLQSAMLAADVTTVQFIRLESPDVVHSRNPFPVGGVVEDPATGAAAAALGGYLRDAGLRTAPFRFAIRQGEAMGRPSLLHVDVPETGGITVSGTAVGLP